MRKFLALILVLFTFLPTMAFADAVMPRYNPDSNKYAPESLPYDGSFSIQSNTATKAIAGPSDGNITVALTNAYWVYSGVKSINLNITAFYLTSGGEWVEASSRSVSISTTPGDYSVTLTVPANRTIYVKFTKGYTNYYAHASFTITD